MQDSHERSGEAGGDDDLERSAALLAAELPSARYHDPRYLRWLYDENPLGPAVRGSLDDSTGRLAHYALVPQEWAGAAGLLRLAISLNAVVASRAQRGGRFTALARDLFARAPQQGIVGTLTVANANSTPAFLRRLGLRMVRPLSVTAIPAFPHRAQVHSTPIDPGTLAGPRIVALAEEIAAVPVARLAQRWTVAQLRWRLANPIARYVLHESEDLLAISTVERAFGIRAAVLLKLWPRAGRSAVSARPIVAAACRHHRAPYSVHAGFNAHVRMPGVAVPRRLLPSPLNLLAGAFDASVEIDALVPDTYEFFDADHY